MAMEKAAEVTRMRNAIMGVLDAHGEVLDDECGHHYGCVCGRSARVACPGDDHDLTYERNRGNWLEHVAQFIIEAVGGGE